MSDYIFKQYSSLEKIFLDELPDTQEFASAGILKGEEFCRKVLDASMQLGIDKKHGGLISFCDVVLRGVS